MIEFLEFLIVSGHIADIAIICLLAELAILWRKKSAAERKAVLFNSLSGIAMLCALRNALTDAPLLLIPLFLSTSFAMHIIELHYRSKI